MVLDLNKKTFFAIVVKKFFVILTTKSIFFIIIFLVSISNAAQLESSSDSSTSSEKYDSNQISLDQTQQVSVAKEPNAFFEKLNFESSYSQYSGNYNIKEQELTSSPTKTNSSYLSQFVYYGFTYQLPHDYNFFITGGYSDKKTTKVITPTSKTTRDHESGFTEPTIGISKKLTLSDNQSLKFSTSYSHGSEAKLVKNSDLNQTKTTARRGYSTASSSLNYNYKFIKSDLGAKISYQSNSMQKKITNSSVKFVDPDKWLITSLYSNFKFGTDTLHASILNFRPSQINTNYLYKNNIKGMNALEINYDYSLDKRYSFSAGLGLYEENYWTTNYSENYKYNSTSLTLGLNISI